MCSYISHECETQTLIKKHHAERMPLCHSVIFLLFWVIAGIMDWKLQKYWATVACFYCKKAINWRNTWSVKLKMMDSERDSVVDWTRPHQNCCYLPAIVFHFTGYWFVGMLEIVVGICGTVYASYSFICSFIILAPCVYLGVPNSFIKRDLDVMMAQDIKYGQSWDIN